MADPKAHQLYKQVPYGLLIYLDSPGVSSVSGGWEIIEETPAHVIIASRKYIDLSAWSAQELTTFTQGVDIQKQMIPRKIPGTTGFDTLTEFDFITTRRLQDSELDGQALFNAGAPGFGGNTTDLMEVIYGERMEYAENSSILGTYVQISGETFGSGNPTAMGKMHWTRLIIAYTGSFDGGIIIWPTNLVVQAMTVEEKDLVWMERLRRSYVLQNPADV